MIVGEKQVRGNNSGRGSDLSLLGQPNQWQTTISEQEFRILADILYSESGISLAETKTGLIVSRLSRRLRTLQLADFGDYCKFLAGPKGAAERSILVSALTTNVTSFFREAHHFEALSQSVLPPLVSAARHGKRVRIWSAACSSGEEPYSIAITLLESCPDTARMDIRILATDIDKDIVQTAKNGIYSENSIKALGGSIMKKYLSRSENNEPSWVVNQEVKNLIHFDSLNLIGDWPMRGTFDVIFCRNVVIYFDADTRAKLWPRFAAQLRPNGHLFIGHSERIDKSSDFLFASAGLTQYRRTGASSGIGKGA